MMKNQKGFTLIEIIAVLVVLGILVAVAIPKFLSLQDEAKNAATEGALGAAVCNVQTAYTKLLVSGISVTSNTIVLNYLNTPSNNFTTVGDFTVTYDSTGKNDILITVTSPADKIGSPSSKIVAFMQ